MTKDRADQIVQNSDAFYRTEGTINGYNYALYNYRLAEYNDFVQHDAFELRGLLFIQDKDGTWASQKVLPKFFNINQVLSTQYSVLKDKKIVRVQDKLDGSMLIPVKLPDNSIVWRTKMSFNNDQTSMAEDLYKYESYRKNIKLQRFVENALDKGLTPIFELTSPFNQIVVQYNESKLSLIQLRRPDGSFVEDLSDIQEKWDIDVISSSEAPMDLDKLLEIKASSTEDIEGFVVTFEDGQMIKIKTDLYMQKHGLVSELKEHTLIQMVLDETIDDVVAQLLPESEKYAQVQGIIHSVSKFYNTTVAELSNIGYQASFEDRKEVAKKFNGTEFFPIIMKIYSACVLPEVTDRLTQAEASAKIQVKEYIKRRSSHLKDAQEFLKYINYMGKE